MRTGFLKIPISCPKEWYFTSLGASAVKVASGIFQAMMLVKIENNGPVTICLEK